MDNLRSPALIEFLRDPLNRIAYERERLVGDWLGLVSDRMDELALNQSDVARRLGVSRAAISKTLRAPSNLTVDSLVAFGLAVGLTWSVEATLASDHMWLGEPIASPQPAGWTSMAIVDPAVPNHVGDARPCALDFAA